MSTAGNRRLLPSLSWMAVCVAGSGLLVYGYLALVARALPSAEYAWFGAYWSLTLVIGFGAFFPVEAELARLVHLRGPAGGLPPRTGRVVAGVTALSVAAVLAGWPLLAPSLGGRAGLLAALLGICLVSAAQFVLRGLLLGRGRTGRHGSVLLLDAGLRVLAAAGIAVVVATPSAGHFAWALVAAVGLAHAPLLVREVRRRPAGTPPRGPAGTPPPGPAGDPATVPAPDGEPGSAAAPSPAVGTALRGGPGPTAVRARAIGHLVIGSLCAQALLNAAPVLVTSAAAPGEEARAAAFVASFLLVRLPLFVAVPLQSALLPALTDVDRSPDRSLRRRFTVGLAALAGGLAVVAAPVAAVAGPPLTGLLFGARYAVPGVAFAVLAAGAALHLALLVASQALVAAARHRASALGWLAGLTAAGVVFAAVPDLVLRAALAFTAGSAVALIACCAALAVRRPDASRPAAGAPAGEHGAR